jgi:uncharacterized protein YbjT (DUF2867 family)
MNDKPILVYGATGTQGSAVARQLLAAGQRIRVLVRDPHKAERWRQAGAEIAIGDFLDRESLMAAHRGIERVFLHLPLQYDFALYKTYGRNAVDAARSAGVKLLVFNTSSHAMAGTDVHVYQARCAVVDYLRASEVPNIVLRTTYYMDNFISPWMKPDILQKGIVAYPFPIDFKVSWISTDDAAAFSLAALNRPDLAGSGFDIGGPEALDGHDIAERFTNALGRPINYVAIAPDDYEQALAKLFGPVVAFEITAQIRFLTKRPNAAVEMSATARLFSVEQLPLEQWIKKQDWSTPA